MDESDMATIVINNQATTNTTEGSRHTATVETRYVKLGDDTKGWFWCKLEKSGRDVYLCEYTKITLVKRENGRTYFKIADGSNEHVGETAYVTGDGERYLVKQSPTTETKTLLVKYGPRGTENSPFKNFLDQQWGTIILDKHIIRVTLNSIWGGRFTPIPPGLHRIMAPDNSHANISTAGYRNSLP